MRLFFAKLCKLQHSRVRLLLIMARQGFTAIRTYRGGKQLRKRVVSSSSGANKFANALSFDDRFWRIYTRKVRF
jgi:hypothetical protein